MQGGTAILRGRDYFLAGPILGAPMSVMALEILMGGGAENVVFAGFAGSIAPELKPGDLFVPSRALSSEGTSAHYPAPLVPEAALHDRLALALGGDAGTASEGCVWSTDAPMREIPEVRAAFRDRGAVAVDMVTSALFAAAGFRGKALAAALLVTDEFTQDGWREGFGEPDFRRNLAALSAGAWKAFV
jgi:uridine phosphorylase